MIGEHERQAQHRRERQQATDLPVDQAQREGGERHQREQPHEERSERRRPAHEVRGDLDGDGRAGEGDRG